ncbi:MULTISPECIES: hypothetical protein [Halomonas]|uniref:hypothetical protein n=1 Tax=Halomonas TaxID=2745 RepID=UPI001C981282|nr:MULTISPECIES: hypothetical protein [Halomonas]MBY5983818.1 hypothetical protein [Halomonas sp. DP5Y7-2]MBY6207359.1 hypothetical protein [Halomonas sp. DP3Y7-2]MBY6228168.1 hypothetical protein [Halomonas sp. DP3Y7-1]MCA0916234.1 hypothetical protein [Halomonas denitrificans]
MNSPPARGATRRRASSRRRRLSFTWTSFDRWLDRIVTVAVLTAVAVGLVALAMSLLVEP